MTISSISEYSNHAKTEALMQQALRFKGIKSFTIFYISVQFFMNKFRILGSTMYVVCLFSNGSPLVHLTHLVAGFPIKTTVNSCLLYTSCV